MDTADFNRLNEEAIGIIKRIKQKNDFISRGSVGSQARLLQQINSDKEFFGREVHRLHAILNQMERGYVDPMTARKLEQLKKEAKKQINRNEYLMKDLIKNTYDSLEDKARKRSQEIEMGELEPQEQLKPNGKMMIVHQGSAIEQELEAEKSRLLKEFERTIVEVHDIMKETEQMVVQQGESLDIITDNIHETKENVVSTNSNMDQANEYQRKSTKKCAVIVGIVLLIAGILTALILFT